MVFSSVSFLFYFLPIFLLFYFGVPAFLKNYVLLAASLIFYYVGVQSMVFIMLGCVLLNYGAALLIDRFRDKKYLIRWILALSVTMTIGLLFYFKYFDFILRNINTVFGLSLDVFGIVLPIGISFYVFQTLSYTIDVFRGTTFPQKNPLLLATYITMFPQLVAGPIVRYSKIERQLKNREISSDKIALGIRRFVIGLAKKVILANTLAQLCQNVRMMEEKTVLAYWLMAVAFLFQIYFDFSGYSDMAIGLGKILGFDFDENFRYPYMSKSVSEFFRRWHISLGTWFRDYVYIPLGGNQKGSVRLCLNLFFVWLLTGFWHGAAWNFVLWGVFYACLLILEKLFFEKVLDSLPTFVGNIYTVLAVLFGFVIFNASTLSEVWTNLSGMFGAGGIDIASQDSVYMLKNFFVVLVISVIAATPLMKHILEKTLIHSYGETILIIAEPIALMLLFVLSTAFLVDSSFNPFIYFRF